MEKTLGEITGGGVRVDRDEPWLFGVDVGRPIVEDFRDWPLEVERDEARRHDRNTSRLLNYLDVSIDVNLGDLIRVKPLGGCWLGFLIDHRSGAFGLIDIFGSVNGGSNYNTGYVECEF